MMQGHNRAAIDSLWAPRRNFPLYLEEVDPLQVLYFKGDEHMALLLGEEMWEMHHTNQDDHLLHLATATVRVEEEELEEMLHHRQHQQQQGMLVFLRFLEQKKLFFCPVKQKMRFYEVVEKVC